MTVQVLAYRGHVGAHRHVASPLTHRHRAVLVDDGRGGTDSKGQDHFVVRVVAAVGVLHSKARVEDRDDRGRRGRRDGRGVSEGTAARNARTRIQLRGKDLGVHPRHAHDVAGVNRVGPDEGLVDRGDARGRQATRGLPDTLTNEGHRRRCLQVGGHGQGFGPGHRHSDGALADLIVFAVPPTLAGCNLLYSVSAHVTMPPKPC